MNKLKVLDCTLRDGGYCNEWKFGHQNILKIIAALVESKINIIECGFLTDIGLYHPDISKYHTLQQFNLVIPEECGDSVFVAMVNCGEFDIEKLPQCSGTGLTGIRLAFHKKQIKQALEECRIIKNKGYHIFVQAMVTLSYSDEEFLDLIHKVNDIKPYAFYIVDSFGMMKRKDLKRLFYMVEHNLSENIQIGFHSHNNMQLAYSNAQVLVETTTNRDLIIDSSIMGMGRGAGNLNTELFVDYLNDIINTSYDVKPLLRIMDEVLSTFYNKNYWGYSLPNYLSALYNTHPNYASYLTDKNSLTIADMNFIFDKMDDEKRIQFDKNYIEQLYLQYMDSNLENTDKNWLLSNKLMGKTVLVIAPGKSADKEKEKIIALSKQENIIVVSINHIYPHCKVDYVFLSNLRRKRDMPEDKKYELVVTSNITGLQADFVLPYHDLLNKKTHIKDNAGMMLIQCLILADVEKILLAGMDGYSHDVEENYALEQMQLITNQTLLDEMNKEMKELLYEYSKQVNIEFVTQRKYI